MKNKDDILGASTIRMQDLQDINNKLLKELWFEARKECVFTYGREVYQKIFKDLVKHELTVISEYRNGAPLIYTLMLIHHEAMSRRRYLHPKTVHAHVGEKYSRSVLLFFLKLTELDPIKNMYDPMTFLENGIFKSKPQKDNGKPMLSIPLIVSDEYCRTVRNMLFGSNSWLHSYPSKYIDDNEKYVILNDTINISELLENEYSNQWSNSKSNIELSTNSIKTTTEYDQFELYKMNGEYKLNEYLIMYRGHEVYGRKP